MAFSGIPRCNWDRTISSLVTVVALHVAANNVQRFCIVIEIQQWVPFAVLSSYKILSTAVNNISPPKFLCKVPPPQFFFTILTKFGFLGRFFLSKSPIKAFQENHSSGRRADKCLQADRQKDGQTWQGYFRSLSLSVRKPIKTMDNWRPGQNVSQASLVYK